MIEASIWDHLAEQGWALTDSAVPRPEWIAWSHHVEDLFARDQLRDARIGRAAGLQMRKKIRGDHIAWIPDEDPSPAAERAVAWLDQLRRETNEALRMGLRWAEGHWARYPAGEGYDWHVDQHRGQGHRKLTFVFYLNENWSPDEGGAIEMQLATESGDPVESPRSMIHAPFGGRLLLFRSDLFPHRVLPATRPRKSLTGWFRDDDAP